MKGLQKPFLIGALFVLLMWVKTNFVLSMFFHSSEITNVSTILVSILIVIVFYQFFPKRAVMLIFGFYFLYCILLFSNALYFRHFGDYWSVFVFYYIDQLNDVSGSIIPLLKWKDILLFLDIPILIFLYKVKKYWFVWEKKKIEETWMIRFSKFVFITVFFAVIFLQNVFVTDGWTFEKRNYNAQFINRIGFIEFYIRDTYEIIERNISSNLVSEEEIEQIKNSFVSEESIKEGSHFGLLNGQNIIFVQLESMSNFLINKTINDQEITPVLNQLSKEHFYASNMYKQIGGGHTSDAEYVSLTSLYPLSQQSVSVMYGDNEFKTIAHILKEKGYKTISAHGYHKEFWKRNVFHQSLGFDDSWFMDSYELNKDQIAIQGGIQDDDFYKMTIEKLSQVNQPFFAHLISFENHVPFSINEEDKELDLGELEGTLLGNYYHTSYASDKALLTLFDELEKTGLIENTTIVIFGDHDAELQEEEMERDFGSLDERDFVDLLQVPFLIVTPDKQILGTYPDVMGQIDITPTILHAMGVVPKDAYFYGRNIFNSSLPKTIRLRFGTIVTNNEYYMMKDGQLKVVDKETGEEREATNEELSIYEEFDMQRIYSENIIKSNLIHHFENEA